MKTIRKNVSLTTLKSELIQTQKEITHYTALQDNEILPSKINQLGDLIADKMKYKNELSKVLLLKFKNDYKIIMAEVKQYR